MDLLLLAVLGLVTWCVASEGAWGAALTCLSVILAGLLAMNFFEPLASVMEGSIPDWRYRWDFICLVGLFIGLVFAFRLGTERISPTSIDVHPLLYEVGRWGCGFLTGYVTMAFLLTAFHTAPLPREFIGFKPERANLLGITAPDRQWLGFTQYVSERSLRHGGDGIKIFDGPYFKLGDPDTKRANDNIWPSFPIRYATRREKFAGSAGAAGSAGGGIKKRSTGPAKKARSGSPSF